MNPRISQPQNQSHINCSKSGAEIRIKSDLLDISKKIFTSNKCKLFYPRSLLLDKIAL
jgi:hypothetical protein